MKQKFIMLSLAIIGMLLVISFVFVSALGNDGEIIGDALGDAANGVSELSVIAANEVHPDVIESGEPIALVLNRAENIASVSTPITNDKAFELGYSFYSLDRREIDALFPDFIGFDRKLVGSAMLHGDGTLLYAHFNTDYGDGTYEDEPLLIIGIGKMARHTIVFNIDMEPTISDVHGVDVTAYLIDNIYSNDIVFLAHFVVHDVPYYISYSIKDDSETTEATNQLKYVISSLIQNAPNFAALLS